MKYVYTIILLTVAAFSNAQTKHIDSKSNAIYYQGRIQQTDSAAILSWSGSSSSIWFKGDSISVVLQDTDTANYYNILIDDNLTKIIHTNTYKHKYLLATNLRDKTHKIQLFKRTCWDKGQTKLFRFECSNTAELSQVPQPPSRKIEFYGNSITCGYAVEDSSGNDSGKGYFKNNYVSYSAITARHFNAQYHCIAKSGIGLMVSWVPLIMPEMFDRLSPTDSSLKWDFALFNPDIVVINIGQNDCWLTKMPKHPEFKHRFGNKAPTNEQIEKRYESFIRLIREKHPNSYIICTLGNMDATRKGSQWPIYITNAVNQLHDPKILTHFFAYKNSFGHPNKEQQKAMAQSLIEFIDKNIEW